MSLLLDTNALLWWLADSTRLGQTARGFITDPRNLIYVSAASAWEITIKVGLGRLAAPPDVASWLPEALETNRFTPLPITVLHAAMVERLPPHHADPFDRILVAQALAEGLHVVTGDLIIERYDVRVIRC